MSREFWIYDNGEEPCLAFQDEENAKEIRKQDKIFYCRQVNPALDAAVDGLVEALEYYDMCDENSFNAREALAQYRLALKEGHND